ncbi:hypothetical protein [Paraflavitalea pollutisoli]|uniref:hypothetical protein n=1 Tax=Paraflavitalea pollutisoli TaxID=3034143 RepID=UPI0023ECFEE8|nr:hypothetical protein [Paraflavitalea sp. H1-2-19X]
MAKQIGIVKITGMLEDLVFYEHPEDGALVRTKSRKTSEQMKASPDYQQTLQNAAEFTNSIHSGELLRKAFRPLLFPIADGKLSSRMNKVMLEIIQLDTLQDFGERMVQPGSAAMLEGFEFNCHSPLKTSFLAPYTITADATAGLIHIDIPPFAPNKAVVANGYVKTVKLVSGAATIDFERESYSNDFWKTEPITLDNEPVEPLRFSYPFQLAPGQVFFLTLGLQQWVHMDELPKKDISKRKYWLVRKMRDAHKMMPFTGGMVVVRVAIFGNSTRLS